MSTTVLLASFFIFGTALAFGLFYANKLSKRYPRYGGGLLNILVLVGTIGFMFFAGEAFFKYVFFQSDGFGVTLQTLKWEKHHLHPRNSLGYRDTEHAEKDFSNKRVVYVVGDSFIEGAGLKDYNSRLSNILSQRLGDTYKVVNIAVGGWSTSDELQGVINYPYRAGPDIIVLSYNMTDIDSAASIFGVFSPVKIEDTPFLRLSKKSYLADFIYWRLFKLVRYEVDYLSYIDECFKNKSILSAHLKEISDFIKYARINKSELIVLVYPQLNAVKETLPYSSIIVDAFSKGGVHVIDMGERLKERPAHELIVNKHDAHPSAMLNKEASELVLKEILTQKQPI